MSGELIAELEKPVLDALVLDGRVGRRGAAAAEMEPALKCRRRAGDCGQRFIRATLIASMDDYPVAAPYELHGRLTAEGRQQRR